MHDQDLKKKRPKTFKIAQSYSINLRVHTHTHTQSPLVSQNKDQWKSQES